jgi:nitrate/nitrite transport system ATP-binding protein
MSFLQIDHVTKYFPNPSGPGQVCIFRDATIKIEKGEFVTCIGHSGCGKSTLLNIIAGLETPTEGGVILNGREASGPGLDRMVVFQNFALMPWMTVFQNIALAVRSAYPDWSHEQVTAHVNKYIALVGLKGAEDKRPTALSGGMKQRVGLARAFFHRTQGPPAGRAVRANRRLDPWRHSRGIDSNVEQLEKYGVHGDARRR